MQKILNRISATTLLLIILAFTFNSCATDDGADKVGAEYLKQFESIISPCIFSKGAVLAMYNEQTDQVVYSEDRLEYLVANLTFDKLYQLTMSANPMGAESVKADCTTIGFNDIAFTEHTLKVVKSTTDMVWLWDSKSYTGFIIKY